MCGICGIVAIDKNAPPITSDILDRMTDAMATRGPDGRGVWVSSDGRCGFGHRRLSIIDLSDAGAQPMSTVDGDVTVTFNGEIYNYQDLKSDLQNAGHVFRTQTDTEVLLHLYRDRGDDMLSDLAGDYAYALWDEKQHFVTLVRDRAGVKPLYYAVVGGYLIFASEIKAILASGLVERQVDEVALYHYMTYLVTPPGMTMVAGIKKLETGSVLTAGLDRPLSKRRYWEALPNQMQVDTQDLDAQFQDLFGQAVAKRTMSDVPLGVLFSGGVDSTLNAAMFGETVRPDPVRTFTVGMRGTAQDESEGARQMAEKLGTEHHEIQITDQTVLDHLDAITVAQDEPISDPVCLPLYFVSQLARESGTTVLQAGEGADETFCGYRAYTKYLKLEKYWKTLSKCPSFVPKILGGVSGDPKLQDMMRRLARGEEFFMSSAVGFYDSEKSSVLNAGFLQNVDGQGAYDAVSPLYQRLDDIAPEASFLQRMTFIELNLRLPELLLMRADKMSMAHSLEVRVPFLDHKLIEFAMSVPDEFKLRDGVPKEPVKRLAASYVGREKVYQPKTGFGAPIKQWFNDGGKLKDSFYDLLNDQTIGADQYFNVEALKSRLSQGVSNHNQAFQLWVVYNFLNWKNLVL